jgi:CBS domain containing-hemolysin-like protein
MDDLLPTAAGLGLVGCFTFSLAAHSLRDFSRSRLAELCERRGNAGRFGEVLRRHESVFIACDAFALLALFGFLACAATWLGLVPGGVHAGEPVAATLWVMLLMFIALLARLVLPWTIARVAGEAFLCRSWPALRLVEFLMLPLILTARRLDRLSHRIAGRPEPASGDAAALTEEIRSVVDEGQREGLIEAEAGSMIQRVIELQNEDIGAVMTPRTDMVTLRADATIEEARRKFINVGHSRVPVVGESVDDVIGLLYAKDLLTYLAIDGAAGRERSIRDLVREPFYVPITTGVDTVLETMKRERVHMAVVVDEYGGVAGLVTLEDVLEEIVGDIVDEYDPAEETGYSRLSDGAFDAEGWVHLDDLNEEFHLELPEDEDFDTLGGFVANELARVPEVGEQFVWKNLRLTITEADRRKVNRVRVEILLPQTTSRERE